MFYFKYFMIFVLIIELMMSYTILTSAYTGYKQKRVKFSMIPILSISLIGVLLVTLAVTVFI